MERLREERMRALAEEDGEENDGPPEEVWGGSDEEPDDEQRAVMARTATHLAASPNAAQLEMRILANHGANPLFAFLRGRWSRAWAAAKARVRAEKEGKVEKKANLGGLMAYGDSDESEEEEDEAVEEDGKKGEEDIGGDGEGRGKEGEVMEGIQVGSDDTSVDEEALKDARRARAREWVERRRAIKAADLGDVGG